MQHYAAGDLVWAKMKGFPAWPGKVVEPDDTVIKPKDVKKKVWVFFYGTNDHAWIAQNFVWPYYSYRDQFTQKNRISQDLKFAQEQIEMSYKNLTGKDKLRQRTLTKSDVTDSNDDESSTSSKKTNGEVVMSVKKAGRPRKRSHGDANSPSTVGKQSARSSSGSPMPKRAAYKQAIAAVYAQPDEKPRKKAKLEEDSASSQKDSQSHLTIPLANATTNANVASSSPDVTTSVASKKSNHSPARENNRSSPNTNPRKSSPARAAIQPVAIPPQPVQRGTTSVHLSAAALLTPPRPPVRIGIICSPEQRNQPVWVRLCHTLIQTPSAPAVTVLEGCCPDFLDETIKTWYRVPTPRQVAQDAEFTICLFPNDQETLLAQTTDPVTGMLASYPEVQSCRRSPSLVILSELDPSIARSLISEVGTRSGHVLESPLLVSGRGDDRGYVMLSAGSKSLFDSVEALLTPMTGHKTLYLGGEEAIGDPSRLLLLLHGLMAVCTAGLAEALALTQRLGLDADHFLQAAELSQVACPLLSLRGEAMSNGKFDEDMPLGLQQRHLQRMLTMSDGVTQPLSLAASVNELYKRAKMKGYGDDGTAAVYKAIQRA